MHEFGKLPNPRTEILVNQNLLPIFAKIDTLLFCKTNMASLSAYLRKLKYGSYTRSEKAPVYEKIAKQYETDAQTVYEIAHGKAIRTQSDLVIVDALIDAGIMSQSRSDI